MKKSILLKSFLLGAIVLLTLSSTTTFNNDDSKCPVPSGMLILSIPDWALGLTINNANQSCDIENLKVLRTFDTELHLSLLKNSKDFGDYTLTKKINPCCPCSDGGRGCCVCKSNLYFASPTSMNASVKIAVSGELLTPDPKYNGSGVDVFQVPASLAVNALLIEGKGITSPLRFVFDPSIDN